MPKRQSPYPKRQSPYPKPSQTFITWCNHAGLKLANFVVYTGTHAGVKDKVYYHFAKVMIWESDLASTPPDIGTKYVMAAIRDTITDSGLRRRLTAFKAARTVLLKFVWMRKDKGPEWTPSERKQHEIERSKRAVLLWEAEMRTFTDIGALARDTRASVPLLESPSLSSELDISRVK